MLRDILDYQGNVIGQLELPDTASEAEWTAALAPYAQAPQDPMIAYLQTTVEEGKRKADKIMEQFKKNNLVRFQEQALSQELALLKSAWVHHRLRAVEINMGGIPMVIDVLNLCISGDIETAYVVLTLMVPDDMTQPQHFLSAEIVDELANLVLAEIA